MNGHSFNQYIPAADRLDERGPQGCLLCTKDPLLHRDAVSLGIAELIGCGLLQLLPVPPRFPVSVQRPLTGNRNILAVNGVDQRGVVIAFHPLPSCKNRREIIGEGIAERNDCPLLNRQVHMAS
ncbi:hypothetical protein D3C80_1594370 [compost metagenome]